MAQENPYDTSASSQVTWAGGETGEDSNRESLEANNKSNNKDASALGLTVTFKDVGVEVHGLGEDYGPTVASVVQDLLPSFGMGTRSTRVSWPEKCFLYGVLILNII